MTKYFIVVLLAIYSTCYSQEDQPLKSGEIKTLKKEAELWYTDQKFSPDSAQIVYDSLIASGQLQKPKKAKPIQRDTIPNLLNIPDGVFTALKWIFYISILVGVIFLILKGNFRRFTVESNEPINDQVTENTTIETAKQLQNIGFEQQIANAESHGNFRLAVRLYYLWAIKKLVNKQLINFHIKKTNIDYCNELLGYENYAEFKNCTNYYNYVWFGEFAISAHKYEFMKVSFNQFLNKI